LEARVTSWTYLADDGKHYPISNNNPWNFFPGNSESLFIELWVVSKSFQKLKGMKTKKDLFS